MGSKRLTKNDEKKSVRKQLSIDVNCHKNDFLKEVVLFFEAKTNPGRRKFDRQEPFIEMTTMGNSVIVSCEAEIIEKVKVLFKDKTREEIFSAPFFYGHSIYYLPFDYSNDAKTPDGYTFNIFKNENIHALYDYAGFKNAIQYDVNHVRPDRIAICAKKNNEIVGIAGASEDCESMWQIGVDVVAEHRNKGIATYLVTSLTKMILEKGIVPYYGTASSNIASQAVAFISGYEPVWMCTYKHVHDGKSPYNENISLKW